MTFWLHCYVSFTDKASNRLTKKKKHTQTSKLTQITERVYSPKNLQIKIKGYIKMLSIVRTGLDKAAITTMQYAQCHFLCQPPTFP